MNHSVCQLRITCCPCVINGNTEFLLRTKAAHSEEHIEDEDAPIFLRFVNLLINDAIFLLDEALGYMKQIGEQQAQKEEWARLPPQVGIAQTQLTRVMRLPLLKTLMNYIVTHKSRVILLIKFTSKMTRVFLSPK